MREANSEPAPWRYRGLAHVVHSIVHLLIKRIWRGQEHLSKGGCLVVINHLSNCDVLSVGEFLIWNGRWPLSRRIRDLEGAGGCLKAPGGFASLSVVMMNRGGAAERRVFAAKRRHAGWGWTLLIFGVFGLVTAAADVISSGEKQYSDPIAVLVLSVLFGALGVYLLRGPVQVTEPVPQPAVAVPPPQTVVKIDLDPIVGASGRSTADRIRDLDKLLHERLISEEEFRIAKAKILGL